MIRIGTSGYAYPAWKKRFYPADLRPEGWLRYYASRFNAVEINSSFYRLPEASTLRRWSNDVPADFLFAFKAPGLITHRKRLKDAGQSAREFADLVGGLGPLAGPLLFQLPPQAKADLERLRDFIADLPAAPRVAFEFRHPSWFVPEVFGLLKARNAALCFNDADLADMPFQPTADWGYLRLRRTSYTRAELADWKTRLARQRWTDAFVFFKHEDKATGPALAAELRGLLEDQASDVTPSKREPAVRRRKGA